MFHLIFYDLLLRAAARLGSAAHPVVMSYPEMPGLDALAADLGVDATLISSFNRELMAALLQWPRTRVCALSAENEPWGLIPTGARLLARNDGAVVVVADSGGLGEQVTDGVDGFHHVPGDAEDLARAIRHVLTLPTERLGRVRASAAKRVLTERVWQIQILQSLEAVVPHVAAIADDMRRELINTPWVNP